MFLLLSAETVAVVARARAVGADVLLARSVEDAAQAPAPLPAAARSLGAGDHVSVLRLVTPRFCGAGCGCAASLIERPADATTLDEVLRGLNASEP